MTTYSDDFSGETVSAAPANWTARWTTTNQTFDIQNPSDGTAEDDRAAVYVHTANAIRLFSYDAMDAAANRQDSEIVIRARFPSVPVADYGFTIWLRASGSSGAEDGYFVRLDNFAGIQWNWQLFRYDAGTISSQIGSDVAFDSSKADGDPIADEWYYARFRVNSTALQFVQWQEANDEPADWSIDETDSDLNVDGWQGFGTTTDETVEIDYVGAASNGDTAPLAASTNTVVRISAAYAQVVHQATDPVVRISAAYAQVVLNTTVASSGPGTTSIIIIG